VRWRVLRGVARGDGVVLRLALLCRAVARRRVATVVRRAARGVARDAATYATIARPARPSPDQHDVGDERILKRIVSFVRMFSSQFSLLSLLNIGDLLVN
jgi:hypothetical protein